jgi:hypothetical protein
MRVATLLVAAGLLSWAESGCAGHPAVPPASAPAQSPAPTRIGNATAAPGWLGTRILPVGSNGFAAAQQTPPELRNRSIITVDDLPPPSDGRFHATVRAVPAAVLADRAGPRPARSPRLTCAM